MHEPIGKIPRTHDQELVEKLLRERSEAKVRKDYEVADALEDRLIDLNVIVMDRQRKYACVTGDAMALIRQRAAARAARDYTTADRLKDEIKRLTGMDISRAPEQRWQRAANRIRRRDQSDPRAAFRSTADRE